MMNPVTGEQEIEIEGKRYALRFDWAALSEIEQKYGEKPNMFDASVVSGVAEAGFRARHPELTSARIMELSPPLVPFAHAVQQALQWAYFGPEAVPSGLKKKTVRNEGGLLRLFGRLFRRG